MSLTTCPDCKREVSTMAAACPNCGRPVLAAKPIAPESAKAAGRSTVDYAFKVIVAAIFFCIALMWLIYRFGDAVQIWIDRGRGIGP